MKGHYLSFLTVVLQEADHSLRQQLTEDASHHHVGCLLLYRHVVKGN